MARFLEQRSKYVGPAKLRGLLLDLGPFPGLIESSDFWTFGEVVELADADRTLPELDEYEGCGRDPEPPLLYQRRAVNAILEDGRDVEVWTYFYTGPVANYQRMEEGRYPVR